MESVQMEMVREILKDVQGQQEQEFQTVHRAPPMLFRCESERRRAHSPRSRRDR
jgi:hypothetical protein